MIAGAEAAAPPPNHVRRSPGERWQGVRAEPVVARGDPAAEVLRVASERGVDLLVAATHGRAGVAAVWAGSVVAQMVERTRWPMLLVRVP